MPAKPLPTEDLAHILTQAPEAFASLANANLFVTGGTGFFGHWLLESLLYANRELALKVRATVLTRDAAAFCAKSPHVANDPAITLLEGDIGTFRFPTEPHTHILHAATDSGGQQAKRSPRQLADSIINGTRHIIDFAQTQSSSLATGNSAQTPLRLLYVSTGAVYGRSTTLLHTPETFVAAHLPSDSYEAAKRASEALCLASENALIAPVIARCFAFVGPHLPLDQHFAIGNFIGAALAGYPIHIKGDGTPRRSWLYMADLAIWLWTLLARGEANRAYNVGSDEAYTIAEAAHLTAATLRPGLAIQIDGTPNPSAPLNSYVPAIDRAHTELGLQITVSIDEALRRTASWHS